MIAWFIGLALQAAEPAPPHYQVHATFDAAGQLDADVTITLPPGTAEKNFLLARRFSVRALDLPEGVVLTRIEPTDRPVEDLLRYSFTAPAGGTQPMRIHMRYAGPINPARDDGVRPLRPEGYELFIDHMWFPVGEDIQTRFTLDADIDGLAPDLIPVGQGEVTRTATGVRIHRDFVDIDIPLVAMRGLQRVSAYGVEFYSRDLNQPVSRYLVRHAEGAARYYERWFGRLPRTVRMAVVWRERSMGYARTGYTVFSEGGRTQPDLSEPATARHAAHEVAHAWWMLASPLTDDFWLVESAAEYCALRYVEHAMGRPAAEALIAEKRTAAASAGPVMGHGRPNRVQLYQKGPLLLIDLEQRIGRPAMDRLLVRMSRERVHTTAVFLRLLTEIGGAEAARAFEASLHA